MGTDSSEVSCICVGIHPSEYYVAFDFLHEVDYHELNMIFPLNVV